MPLSASTPWRRCGLVQTAGRFFEWRRSQGFTQTTTRFDDLPSLVSALSFYYLRLLTQLPLLELYPADTCRSPAFPCGPRWRRFDKPADLSGRRWRPVGSTSFRGSGVPSNALPSTTPTPNLAVPSPLCSRVPHTDFIRSANETHTARQASPARSIKVEEGFVMQWNSGQRKAIPSNAHPVQSDPQTRARPRRRSRRRGLFLVRVVSDEPRCSDGRPWYMQCAVNAPGPLREW